MKNIIFQNLKHENIDEQTKTDEQTKMCIFLSFISFQQQNCEQVVESVSCTLLLKEKKF